MRQRLRRQRKEQCAAVQEQQWQGAAAAVGRVKQIVMEAGGWQTGRCQYLVQPARRSDRKGC
eukprot:847545-Rhodomonas_salina.1